MADNDMTTGPSQVMPELAGDRPREITPQAFGHGHIVTLADVKNNDGLAWQNMPVCAMPYEDESLDMGTAADYRGVAQKEATE